MNHANEKCMIHNFLRSPQLCSTAERWASMARAYREHLGVSTAAAEPLCTLLRLLS